MTALSQGNPRILAAIRQEDQRAEWIASLLQAAVLALLSLLYFVAPKAEMSQWRFEPVPLLLAAYWPVVLLRLWLSARGRMGPWLSAAAIVGDMLALAGLIFSFHLQYGQPAPFSLKAPTFAYFFIFIAVRTLRFDWRYVAFAGLVAAAFWGLLLAYALAQPDTRLTHSFVDYIFGMPVLLGAEIDKIISLLAVAAILAAAVARSRRLLERATRDAIAQHDLARFFPGDVTEHILASDKPLAPGDAAVREASVLSLDLRGFTGYTASHTPRQVMALLGDFQQRMVAVIFAHGGTVDKFLGDGILAHFGAARPDPAHAAQCLRAAVNCGAAAQAWAQERVAAGRSPLRIGAGCASGEVLFGVVGDARRLELTVIGDAVNLSAKLEKHSKTTPSPLVATAAMWKRARQQGYDAPVAARLEAAKVAGVSGAMDLVALALAPGTTREADQSG